MRDLDAVRRDYGSGCHREAICCSQIFCLILPAARRGAMGLPGKGLAMNTSTDPKRLGARGVFI